MYFQREVICVVFVKMEYTWILFLPISVLRIDLCILSFKLPSAQNINYFSHDGGLEGSLFLPKVEISCFLWKAWETWSNLCLSLPSAFYTRVDFWACFSFKFLLKLNVVVPMGLMCIGWPSGSSKDFYSEHPLYWICCKLTTGLTLGKSKPYRSVLIFIVYVHVCMCMCVLARETSTET